MKIGTYVAFLFLFHYYLFSSTSIHYVFIFRCEFCKENDKERCYHWSVGDEHSIDVFRRQLEEHLHLYLDSSGRHYEEVKCCSKIIYNSNDLTGQNNRYNIVYIISGATDAETQDAKLFLVTC